MYFGNRFKTGGQQDPNIRYELNFAHSSNSSERLLSIARTALVYIEEEEGSVAILDCNSRGNAEGYVHYPTPGSEVVQSMVEAGYPRIFSPTRSLFEFWRRNKTASEDTVQTEYGFRVESWLNSQTANGSLYDFTFFNAMKRTYEDQPAANHVEIRNPGSSLAAARIPYEEFVRLVDPPAWAPRSHEYVELWLPRLAMDANASNWHQAIINARMAELMDELGNDLDRAARNSIADAFDRIVDTNLSDLRDVA